MVDRYRNYKPQYNRVKEQPKRHPKRWFMLFAVIALMLGIKHFAGGTKDKKTDTHTASVVAKPKPVIAADPIADTTWNTLGSKVNALIAQQPDLDVSVSVIDIGTNTKGNYGIQDNFAGASTTKVLTAVTFLHELEQGKRSFNTQLNGTTAKQQLKLMINQSNNDSWAALNNLLSYADIETYAHSLGISSYSSKDNTITASDEALLLQKLYTREVINEANTSLLLSYMQNTNNEAMIPAVIPAGATIYHKYGQLEDRLHDASIVTKNNRAIALVIYTKGGAKDGSNYTSRVAFVQSIAKSVFDTIYP